MILNNTEQLQIKNICIWGGSELGEFVIKQIKVYFPNWKINFVIDSNPILEGKIIQGFTIFNPNKILLSKNNEIDLLIICSSQYVEITKMACSKYYFNEERILYTEICWPTGLQINPKSKWEKLVFKPFIENSDIYFKVIHELEVQEGELNKIGIEYGTDKASIIILKNGFLLSHDYLRHYDRLFQNFKYVEKTICELGCGKGASLKMWKNYFNKAKIVGVDINSNAKNFEEERIEIIIGNSTSEDTIKKLKEYYQYFFIIIDDASHAWGDMRTSFEKLWNTLEHGGYYILEDCQCGSQGAYPEHSPIVWDSQSIFDYILDRTKIMNFGRDWNPEYNTYHFEHLPPNIRKIESELDSVMIIHGACIIKKR